jgi:hypothetical protein
MALLITDLRRRLRARFQQSPHFAAALQIGRYWGMIGHRKATLNRSKMIHCCQGAIATERRAGIDQIIVSAKARHDPNTKFCID